VNPPSSRAEEFVTFREFEDLRARFRDVTDKLDTEKADATAVSDLAQKVDSLRSALITFSLSIAGSAIVFALGTLALLWQLGGHG
jgi:hypothetical protein